MKLTFNLPVHYLPLSSYSLVNSQSAPGPSPGPVDPMEHVINLFDQYLKLNYNQSLIPSMAVVIVQNGKTIYMNNLGVKNLASGEPVDENTLFMIGSVTKQFAATNIAQLVSAGLMSWDDPVAKYYPDKNEFQLYSDYVTDNLTIRDFLCHRSGLPDHNADALWSIFNYTYSYNLHQLRYVKNNTPFRSTFNYHNIIYSLPAYCAARANNTAWNELIKEEHLEPLGMTTATTTYSDFMNSPNHATPYTLRNGTFKMYVNSADGVGPAGIIACSINEIVNWLNFQITDTGMYNGVQIVSKKDLDETHNGQIELSEQFKELFNSSMYGFGWIVGDDQINHNGDLSAFHAHVKIYESKGLGIAIFTNGGDYADNFRYLLANKFMELLNGDETIDPWNPTPITLIPGPTPPIVDPQPLSTYIGVYSNAFYGNINITNNNNTLICYYGNNTIPFELNHWNGDEFNDTTTTMNFNFTDISNSTAQKLTIPLRDYISKTNSSSFNRINST